MFRSAISLFSSSTRFIMPPGDSPSILISSVASKHRPSVAAMALKACGVSPSLKSEFNSGDGGGGKGAAAAAAPGLNAADLTDEEVTRCLQVLPHYVDLGTSELGSAASVRSLARARLSTTISARRNALRDLRAMLMRKGFVATEEEAQQMSLAEIRERFGDRQEVRTLVRNFRDTFTIDVDRALSTSALPKRNGRIRRSWRK